MPLPDLLAQAVATIQPRLVIHSTTTGRDLWVNPFVEGGIGIPGYELSIGAGEPPEGAFTNPITYFAGEAAGVVSAPGWFGIPWIAWAGIGVGLLLLPRLLRGRS